MIAPDDLVTMEILASMISDVSDGNKAGSSSSLVIM